MSSLFLLSTSYQLFLCFFPDGTPLAISDSEERMYRRILVAVDGSYTSNLALQEAFKLAKETKAKLHLVHVIDVTPGVEGGFNPETLRRMVREEGNDLLNKVADLAGQAGVDADTAMLEEIRRKFSKAIANEARRWDADLIVMGTHGRMGIARLVLGSVAEGVVHIAPVPVLLIRCP
jgi:nucleotide-binding universal stress UspA family protein